jgi:glutamate/tyrosine decarboxylase-like PLP-dependent enzyme
MTVPTEGAPCGGLSITPERMEALASLASRLIIGRLEGLPAEPAWRGASRAEPESLLREDPPEEGRPPEEVVERAAREILPVAGRVDHPRFFAFVPSSATWLGVLADYMAAGHNIFQGTWLGASGPSQLELVVIDWFRDWIGYPESAGGLFTSGGSAASLDAFVAAREAAGNPDRATVYVSDQAHSALTRAARIVGVRPERVRMLPSDGRYRLEMDALRAAVQEDRDRGDTPIAVCANAGTTNTGAVDPLPEIADFCAEQGLWMHVDAAYGGFAVLSDEGRRLLQGMERADSIAMDAHKWLFQPFEAGCLMVKDVRQLEQAFSVQPEYLQDTDWGREHPNFGDRGLQLSRSFRALKVWMSVQAFGMSAFRRAVTSGIELAARAEEHVRASDVLEMANPASLGVLCFRVNPKGCGLDDEALEHINEGVQARIIDTGTAMMSSTRLRGLFSLRLCIMNHTTTWDDVRETLEAIERFGAEAVADTSR